MSTAHDFDDRLDSLLQEAAPATPFAVSVSDDELRAAAESSRLEAARDARRRRAPRIATVAAIAVLALGGTGVAAASTGGSFWPDWAAAPDATLTFTLPSGGSCEYLIGNLANATPEITEATRAFLSAATVPSYEQIDQDVVAIHGESLEESPDSERDQRYKLAVGGALTTQLDAVLEEQGLDISQRPEISGVISCSEAGE
jgi:hypothetical protein